MVIALGQLCGLNSFINSEVQDFCFMFEESQVLHAASIDARIIAAILDQEQGGGWGRHHAKQSLEMEAPDTRSFGTLLGQLLLETQNIPDSSIT